MWWRWEFTSTKSIDYCNSKEIQRRYSYPYALQQNGVVERKHRHISEVGRFKINRLPSPLLHNISPFESLFQCPLDYSILKSYGCNCFPLIPKGNRSKLDPMTTTQCFVGYSTNHKGYLCLQMENDKITTSCMSNLTRDSSHFNPLHASWNKHLKWATMHYKTTK